MEFSTRCDDGILTQAQLCLFFVQMTRFQLGIFPLFSSTSFFFLFYFVFSCRWSRFVSRDVYQSGKYHLTAAKFFFIFSFFRSVGTWTFFRLPDARKALMWLKPLRWRESEWDRKWLKEPSTLEFAFHFDRPLSKQLRLFSLFPFIFFCLFYSFFFLSVCVHTVNVHNDKVCSEGERR